MTGPNGHLWFVETGADKVGEFDPATRTLVGEYAIPTANSGAASITSGPGGLLYFTESTADKIGTIDPTTHTFNEYANGGSFLNPLRITTGPDGDLYFTEVTGGIPGNLFYADAIGRLDAATHTISNFVVPNESTYFQYVAYGPRGIATGPDGSLWLAGFGNIDKATLIPPSRGALDVRVFNDPLGNGTVSGGPLAGYTVYIDANADGVLDAGDPTAATDATGDAQFLGIAPGVYTVRVVTSPGDLVTVPAGASPTVGVVADQITTGPTFGLFLASPLLPFALDPAPFGAHNPDVSTAEVVGLYKILLNRAPDTPGLSAAVSYLKTGGSLQALAAILMDTGEYQSDVIKSDYQNFFGRAATAGEVSAWLGVIQQDHLTEEQVAFYFLSSDVFTALHPDDASFISAVYGATLARPAMAFEVAAWDSVLKSGVSRSTMVSNLIHSTFAAQRAVEGFAAIFWAQPIGGTDEATLVNFLVNGGGTLAGVAAAFVNSPPFIARANATVG